MQTLLWILIKKRKKVQVYLQHFYVLCVNGLQVIIQIVNVRAVMDMRKTGCDHAILEKLVGLLSIPEPP